MQATSNRVKRLHSALRRRAFERIQSLLDAFCERSRALLVPDECGTLARALRQAGKWDTVDLSPELRALWCKLLADDECRRAWLAIEKLARTDGDGSMAHFRERVEQPRQ
jgi:hypothetical protein